MVLVLEKAGCWAHQVVCQVWDLPDDSDGAQCGLHGRSKSPSAIPLLVPPQHAASTRFLLPTIPSNHQQRKPSCYPHTLVPVAGTFFLMYELLLLSSRSTSGARSLAISLEQMLPRAHKASPQMNWFVWLRSLPFRECHNRTTTQEGHAGSVVNKNQKQQGETSSRQKRTGDPGLTRHMALTSSASW